MSFVFLIPRKKAGPTDPYPTQYTYAYGREVSGVSVQVSGQADSWEAGRPGSWKARLFATPSAL